MFGELANEIEEIFHCAAITEFNQRIEIIEPVNVKGTKFVFDFALKCKENGNFRKCNHISTIYICGTHNGIFSEKDLDTGQSFNTTYEKTKFDAEKLVVDYRKNALWIDVFRLPAVLGESVCGKTLTFNQAFYQTIHLWNANIFKFFPDISGYFLNAAFLDEICKSILKLSSQNQIKNQTYHAFGKSPVSLQEILLSCAKFLHFKLPTIVPYDEFINKRSTSVQKHLLKYNLFFLNTNVTVSSTETCRVLDSLSFNYSEWNYDSLTNLLKYPLEKGFLKVL